MDHFLGVCTPCISPHICMATVCMVIVESVTIYHDLEVYEL